MRSTISRRRDPAAQAHRQPHGVIGRVRWPQLPRPVAAGFPGHGGVPIPVAPPISPFGKAFDAPGMLRDPEVGGRFRPFIDELIWYVRALASPRRRSV